MRLSRTLRLAATSALAMGLFSPSLQAKSSGEVQYSLSQVYSGALRYLRIDLGYEITERDPETAYLLFRYKAPGTRDNSFGAIEIVKTEKLVRVVVNLPQLPSYHEAVLRDGLVKKLQEDYGVREADADTKRAPDDNKDRGNSAKTPGNGDPSGAAQPKDPGSSTPEESRNPHEDSDPS